MKKLLLVACVLSCTLLAKAKDWTQYVNPLMGSQSTFELSTGNTYPAIARPWGMNFWTPQTGKMGDGWQYTYTANKIRGFKQTHQPSPWINDYGQFSIMPIVGKPVFDEEKRASWFAQEVSNTPAVENQTQAPQDEYTKVEVKDLPEAVAQAIAKSYEGATIKEAYVAEKETGKVYKVILTTKDAQEVTVLLNEKGEEVK